MSSKSLKADYQKWLWMLAIADIALILLFLVPDISETELSRLANWRLLITIIVPVGVLLLVNVLPHKLKCMAVYWKPYGWLPGCEVFTKFALDDARIDMKELTKHIGKPPSGQGEQNARWYQLYKLVENEPEITEVHRNFLMYRDMATLSFPFIALAPLFLFWAGASREAQWGGAALFLIQFLLTAISARWSGIRFVCNVLALHSARPIQGAKLNRR
ncbi:MAG TPA: hypothetical protein VNQ99_15870 [Xanthobacteraceae bacterium]|nr:hypothetical protein [Xanthobacteraceae bacterium]